MEEEEKKKKTKKVLEVEMPYTAYTKKTSTSKRDKTVRLEKVTSNATIISTTTESSGRESKETRPRRRYWKI